MLICLIKRYLFSIPVYLVFILGCKSAAYFRSPNEVVRQYGTIYMQNGTEKNGEITISFDAGYTAKDFIKISVGGKVEKIYKKDVKGYKIKDKYYVPAYIDLDGNGIGQLLFVQRLTNEGSKIHLYEFYRGNTGSSVDGRATASYYISLPAFPKYEVWNVEGKYLVPKFDQKMSKLVADCATLSQKIQQQAKGYFYPQISLSGQKKADIVRRIIDEYNECK